MQKFLVLMVFCHSQVFVNGDFHKSVMSSACTKVLFLYTEVQRLRITAEHIESLLQQFMHCTFFLLCSVFWRTWTWVYQHASVSRRWALMVSVQMVSTLFTGLQTGQATSDSHPFISKGKCNITVQVDIEIKILCKGSKLSKIYYTNVFQQ